MASLTSSQLRQLLRHVVAKSTSFLEETAGSKNPQIVEMRAKHETRKELAEAVIAAMQGNAVDLRMLGQ